MKKLLIALGILLAISSMEAIAAPVDGTLFNPSQLSPPVKNTTEDGRQLFSVPANKSMAVSLLAEVAGQANVNSFGIYDPKNPTNKLEVFSGSNSPVINKLITYNHLVAEGISPTNFGFYLDTNNANQGTFYSQNALNAGTLQDHVLSFRVGGVSAAKFSYILGWEDLKSNGDNDYNDMVVGAKVVPIPGAVWLFGSGIAGLLGLSRRKAKASLSA